MTVNIAEDTWREIVEFTCATSWGYDISSLQVLATTNKLLHYITVPILFRTLKFRNRTSYDSGALNTAITRLISTYNRARSLCRAPHLLEHVREVSLDQWTQYVYGSIGTGIDGMVLAIYESLIGLIERIPRLRHITVSSSPISSRLLPLLFSNAHIERVSLSFESGDFAMDIPPYLSISRHLRHFHYRRYANPSPMDVYLPLVFEQCGQDLQSLEIPATELPKIWHLFDGRSLSLRELLLDCTNLNSGTIQNIWNFLPFCPELRVLGLTLLRTDIPPLDLASDVIPHLESLASGSGLTPIFTVGRKVKTINIIGVTDISPVHELVGCPTSLLRLSLTMKMGSRYGKLVEFMRSLNICTHLVILRLSFFNPSRGFSPESEMSLEEREEFMDALCQIRTLRVCDVTGRATPRNSTEITCPMGRVGDQENRRHPSLESIRAECIDKCWWIWFHSEGWQRMPDSFRSPYEL